VGRGAGTSGNPYTLAIDTNGVTSARILADAVTSAKILDGTIATGDLADSLIATGKIQDAAVSYAKIQNVTASSLLGNPTGSAASASEITLGSGLQFSGSTLALSGGVLTSLGAPGGSYANGGNVSSGVLSLAYADGTNPGIVSTGTQTFAGPKNFANNLTLAGTTVTGSGASLSISSAAASALSLDSGTTGGINIGTGANVKAITIGNATNGTNFALNTGNGGFTMTASTFAFSAFNSTITTSSNANLAIYPGGSGTLGIDAAAVIGIGGGALSKTVTIGNFTGSTAVNINSGTGGVNLWSSATTGAAMTLSAGGVSSGKGLQVSSTSNNMSGNLGEFYHTQSNANNTGVIMNLGSTGALSSIKGLVVTTSATKGVAAQFSGAIAETPTNYSTTGSANNVALGNFGIVRLTGASAQTITGIDDVAASGTGASHISGRRLTLSNAGSSAATISNQSASSSAANRIITGTGADLSLAADMSVDLIYDGTTGRWRVVSPPSSGGSASFNGLSGATASNTIDNGAHTQTWNWNSMTTGNGLVIASTSATTGNLVSLTGPSGHSGKILSISGAHSNYTDGALKIDLPSQSFGIGLYVNSNTGGGDAVKIVANGLTNGNALEVTSGSGSVTGPLALFESTSSGATVMRVGMTANSYFAGSTTLDLTNSSLSGSAYTFKANDDGTYSDATPIVMDGSGRMAIGTSTTSAALTISGAGNSGSTGAMVWITNTDTNGTSFSISSRASGGPETRFAVRDETNNAERWSIDGTGRVNFNNVTGATIISGQTMASYQINSLASRPALAIVGTGSHAVANLYSPQSAGTASFLNFYTDTGGTATLNGSITTTGSTTAYNTTSDQRLKIDTKEMPAGLEVLRQIPVHRYAWNTGAEGVDDGFFAQELYNYFPDAVTVGSDERDASGKLVRPWSVDYGRLTPLLVQSMQELADQVDSDKVTTGVATIEGRSKGVRVTFEKPYTEQPVVTITPVFGVDLQVTEVDRTGFTLLRTTTDTKAQKVFWMSAILDQKVATTRQIR